MFICISNHTYMVNNTTKWIILASTLAVIALSCFQVKWLNQSRDLIEKQFDQKVTMALCQSIDEAYTNNSLNPETVYCCYDDLVKDAAFCQSVTSNLERYQVALDYRLSLSACNPASLENGNTYGCKLDSEQDEAEQWLAVKFPDKKTYVTAKMNFMFISSSILIGFIGLVFIWANYTLWRQRKLNHFNVDFFNHMAHELRTPLTSISLATRLLADQNQEIKSNKYFDIIQRQNNHLKDQVGKMLFLSNAKNKNLPIEMEWFALDDLLNQLKLDYQFIFDEMDATLTIEPSESTYQVYGNAFHLTQAFKNLIDNSIKYADDRLEVSISVNKTDSSIAVNFSDNGMGIDVKDQPYVFEKFHRAKNSKNKAGFGLGLSYVKSVAELHNGMIRLIANMKKGTHFEFSIPIKTPSIA